MNGINSNQQITLGSILRIWVIICHRHGRFTGQAHIWRIAQKFEIKVISSHQPYVQTLNENGAKDMTWSYSSINLKQLVLIYM